MGIGGVYKALSDQSVDIKDMLTVTPLTPFP